ncbi:hypothetical protein [Kibdelosporangium philippinense]|uniref:hypothetical protein n=1 Tax=Kibdelosporangium philippinense TaxID=211113 RepID=UPI00360DBA64
MAARSQRRRQGHGGGTVARATEIAARPTGAVAERWHSSGDRAAAVGSGKRMAGQEGVGCGLVSTAPSCFLQAAAGRPGISLGLAGC